MLVHRHRAVLSRLRLSCRTLCFRTYCYGLVLVIVALEISCCVPSFPKVGSPGHPGARIENSVSLSAEQVGRLSGLYKRMSTAVDRERYYPNLYVGTRDVACVAKEERITRLFTPPPWLGVRVRRTPLACDCMCSSGAAVPGLPSPSYLSRIPITWHHGILVQNVPNVNEPSFLGIWQRNHIDLGISIRCYQKFGKRIIQHFATPDGASKLLNLHPGSLAQYRGVMTTIRAMSNGDKGIRL